MSQGWSPPPYPAQPPQSPQPQQRPPGGLPTWAQILIGAVVGPFVLGASALPASIIGGMVDTGGSLGALIGLGSLGVPLLVLVGGLVWRHTRWYAVGALIGLALLFIVLAGACIALLVAASDGTI